DGIMLLSPDTKSSISIVKMIEKAGIPLIITNAKADESVQKDLTYVGADLEKQGEMAGEMALEVMGEKGGKICIIEGPGGHDAALSRSAGFKKAVEGKPGVEIIGVQQADWDRAIAMQKMDDFLVQFPEIDVVFCHDDNMAIGAVEAAKAAGRLKDITVLGVGASIDGLAAIKSGEMFGTVLQAPGEEGSKSVQAIVDTMDGKTLDKWIVLDCDKITKENVDEYKGEW
ncbi:MAG: sugar ABC transporter substrate-binding protein, partial [Christensenella sp.]